MSEVTVAPAGPSGTPRTFDLLKATHPKNQLFQAVDKLPWWFDQPLRSRLWTPGRQTDQGREGACVGHGDLEELMSTPVPIKDTWADANAMAHEFYLLAQRLDEEPGENYEGSTLTGGGEALRKLKYIDGYYWLRDAFQVALGIINSGPAVVGIPWLSGMDELQDEDDFFRVSGRIRGWHCCTLYGVQPRGVTNLDDAWTPLRNSWDGEGNGRLRFRDLQTMFDAGADAWVALGRHHRGMMAR